MDVNQAPSQSEQVSLSRTLAAKALPTQLSSSKWRNLSQIFWHFLNFSPFFLLVWFVWRFSVNVPLIDEWWLAPLFHAVRFKQATFADFFALNNEHRILFPKLIWTPLAFATHWNLRIEMMLHVLIALIIFTVFYSLALHQAKETGSAFLNLANLATSILFFSLVQYATWLWGISGSFLMVQAAVVLAIGVCLTRKLRPGACFCGAALFCFVASFSSAQGLLSWFALLPCVAMLRVGKRPALKFGIWGLVFALCFALYTYHFTFPNLEGNESASVLHGRLVHAVGFFLALLGAPFCQSDANIPVSMALTLGDPRHLRVAGALVFLALVGCLVALRDYPRKDIVAPWLSVALYGLLFAAMVTAGRISAGFEVAMQSRYIAGTILVPIAVVQLGRLVCVHKGRTVYPVYLALLGALGALVGLGSFHSLYIARHLKQDISEAKLFLEVIRYVDPKTEGEPQSRFVSLCGGKGIGGNAELLNEIGFLPLASNIAFVNQPLPDRGSFESVEASGDLLHLRRSKDEITVSGWASLSGSQRSPSIVMVSYDQQELFLTGAVAGSVDRPDIAALRHDPRYYHSGWKVTFPAKFLPPGDGVLKAWLYDSAAKQFIRLPESGGEKNLRVENP